MRSECIGKRARNSSKMAFGWCSDRRPRGARRRANTAQKTQRLRGRAGMEDKKKSNARYRRRALHGGAAATAVAESIQRPGTGRRERRRRGRRAAAAQRVVEWSREASASLLAPGGRVIARPRRPPIPYATLHYTLYLHTDTLAQHSTAHHHTRLGHGRRRAGRTSRRR